MCIIHELTISYKNFRNKRKFDKFINKNLIDYSSKRNFDLGSPHTNVSTLSPYIGRRLMSETDILDIAFQKFKPNKIEKFVQEIFGEPIGEDGLNFIQ